MPFEEFIRHYAEWYGAGRPAACLVGIRTDESLNRYRAMTCGKETWKGRIYSTRNGPNSWNFYPLYDWGVEDLWVYNGKFGKDYNRLYDLFYKAGVPLSKMRVDEPFGNEAKAGLSLFRVIEPESWARVVNRVSGRQFRQPLLRHQTDEFRTGCRRTTPGRVLPSFCWRRCRRRRRNTTAENSSSLSGIGTGPAVRSQPGVH